MDATERERLRGEVDALESELAEERFRHVAGIEPQPALVALFQARSRAAHKETARELREAGESSLADRVAGLRAERAAAEAEEAWRAAEVGATGRGPDGPIGLAAAMLAIGSERDRARRRMLGAAVAEAFEASAEPREEASEQRSRARAEVGLAPDWQAVVGADGALSASDDAYADVLAWHARREAGLAPRPRGDLDRADLLYLLALPSHAGLFPAGMLALELRKLAAQLRLDLSRVRVDEGGRPAQWPGAHALGRRVSFRRQGGVADWVGLLEAVGAALAVASSPAHGRQPSFPAAVGSLLAGLLLDARFLEKQVGVEGRRVPDLARLLSLRQLFRLRAHAAALRVATEVERGLGGEAWRKAHREALSLATLAAWPAGLHARDAGAAGHAAALAGAALAESLRADLVERFDEDWWRNPRAAESLGVLLSAGGAPAAEAPPPRRAAEALVARLA